MKEEVSFCCTYLFFSSKNLLYNVIGNAGNVQWYYPARDLTDKSGNYFVITNA